MNLVMDSKLWEAWKRRHSHEVTQPIFDKFIQSIVNDYHPKLLCVIGYFFGVKAAIFQINAKHGLANASAITHPSAVSIEELEAIGSKKPIFISAAENCVVFPQELVNLTTSKLKEIGST